MELDKYFPTYLIPCQPTNPKVNRADGLRYVKRRSEGTTNPTATE
jgi:hypothetical protein